MKPITKQPASWLATAPIQIVETVDIDASADDVFAIIADHERWPEWFEVLKSVTKTNDVDGVGGTRTVAVPGMTFDEEFTEWEPGRVFAFTIVAMSRPIMKSMNERAAVEPLADDRCRVTYTQALDPKPWAKPLVVIVKAQMKKGLQKGLQGLKARAER